MTGKAVLPDTAWQAMMTAKGMTIDGRRTGQKPPGHLAKRANRHGSGPRTARKLGHDGAALGTGGQCRCVVVAP